MPGAAPWSTRTIPGAWQDLRGEGRTVIGIDIEPSGGQNPVIDEFRLIGDDRRWPLDDASVDLAVSDFVLEHVTDPGAFVHELARVLRPGGVFIARTISRRSILAAAATVVPNHRHAKALERLQPGRKSTDVFQTAYQMNTRRDLARLFGGDFDWALARRTGLKQYFRPWPRVRRMVAQVERHLPTTMWMALVVFHAVTAEAAAPAPGRPIRAGRGTDRRHCAPGLFCWGAQQGSCARASKLCGARHYAEHEPPRPPRSRRAHHGGRPRHGA